jgi:outer membrane protein
MCPFRHPLSPGLVLAYLGVTASLAFVSTAARAQAEESIEPPLSDSWKFSVGLGAVSQAEFPGSDQRKTRVLPILGASYGRFFVGGLPGGGVPLGVGANLYQSGSWKFGMGLGGGFGKARKESDDSRLAGLGDIDNTPRAAVFGSYAADWLALRGNVSTDIGGKGQGTLASVELEGRYRLTPELMLSAGPGLTWADRKYTRTFFGIDLAQSVASGRAEYSAGSGLNSLRFSLGAVYSVTPQWQFGVRGSLGRLQGDAAESPLTFRAKQTDVGLFTSYRF